MYFQNFLKIFEKVRNFDPKRWGGGVQNPNLDPHFFLHENVHFNLLYKIAKYTRPWKPLDHGEKRVLLSFYVFYNPILQVHVHVTRNTLHVHMHVQDRVIKHIKWQ